MALFTFKVYSKRHGHDDTVTVTLEESLLKVIHVTGGSQVTLNIHGGGEWKNADNYKKDILESFENDDIKPPAAFLTTLREVWDAWRKNQIGDDETKRKLKGLFNQFT